MITGADIVDRLSQVIRRTTLLTVLTAGTGFPVLNRSVNTFVFTEPSVILAISMSSWVSLQNSGFTLALGVGMDNGPTITVQDSCLFGVHTYGSTVTTVVGSAQTQDTILNFSYPFFPRADASQSLAGYASPATAVNENAALISTIYYAPLSFIRNLRL